MAKTAKMKDQYYKLGEKAQQFYDPLSKTKILKGQIVKVEGNLNKSGKLKLALLGQHIVKVTEEEYSNYLNNVDQDEDSLTDVDTVDVSEESEDVVKFRKLSDAQKRKLITDEYELDEEDLKKLKSAKGEEIVDIYKELTEESEEEEEEGDEDDN